MAAGDSARFPLPITFDEPKAGYARLILTVEEMKVKKPLIGSAKPENAEVTSSFDNGIVLIRCVVSTTDGKKVVYEYNKNLPFDVIEKDCTVEVRKAAESQIIVMLAKANPRESWASQSKYFMQPPSND